MGTTLVIFSESVALVTTQVLLAGVPDSHVRVEGDNIVVPRLNQIVGEYAIGTDIQNVEIQAPSLRRMFPENIAPVENVATPTFPPDPLIRKNNPLPLEIDEQLTALAGNSNAGAQQESVILWLADGPIQPVTGPIFTIAGTVTVPATAYAWGNAPITLSDSLPVGDYKIVGGRCELSTLIAWRINFVGGIWRPGTLGVASISAKTPKGSRYGDMGVWGIFSHLTPPTIDTFDTGAGGAAIIYLDLIKV